MDSQITVTCIADGVYRVEHDGHGEIVYVAGTKQERWAFWNGHVFRETGPRDAAGRQPTRAHHVAQSLDAPMPATVIKVLVAPGSVVKKGDTVIVLEAMKMELPMRAPSDAIVRAVHCHEGDLVQPDATLVEME